MLTEREKTGEKGSLANMRTDSRNAVPALNQTSGKAVKLSKAFFKADVIFQSVILLASCMVMYYSISFYLNTRACFSKPLLFLLGKDDVRHNSYKKNVQNTSKVDLIHIYTPWSERQVYIGEKKIVEVIHF